MSLEDLSGISGEGIKDLLSSLKEMAKTNDNIDAKALERLENVEVVQEKLEVAKRPIDDILNDAEKIDVDLIASQVLDWATENVENYVDNHVTSFKLDLALDNCDEMSEAKKLQDLYRAIPYADSDIHVNLDDIEEFENNVVDSENEKECQACKDKLDLITKKAFDSVQSDKIRLQKLFKRLVYYYEMKGVKDGVPIIQEQEGFVKILRFEYEAFSVGVKVVEGLDIVDKQTNEIVKQGDKEIVKEYVIPEGFTLWIQLVHKPKARPISLF